MAEPLSQDVSGGYVRPEDPPAALDISSAAQAGVTTAVPCVGRRGRPARSAAMRRLQCAQGCAGGPRRALRRCLGLHCGPPSGQPARGLAARGSSTDRRDMASVVQSLGSGALIPAEHHGGGAAVILVYAGRRPSGEDGPFPASREEYLRERVERLLAGLRPTAVVGSAAAGSDIVVLEVATQLGIAATAVITEDLEAFATDSVEDHPGWRTRLDAVLDSPLVEVERVHGAEPGAAGYRAVTRRIIKRAVDMRSAERTTHPEAVLLGLVLSGGRRGAEDYTQDLRDQLEAAGEFVLGLDPR